MGKTTYKIYSLGCKVNQYDSSRLRAFLDSANFKLVEKSADLAVINTCAVTKSATTKSARMISRARKENKKAKTVLMGCWPKAYREEIVKEKLGIDLVWEVGDLKNLLIEIKKLFKKQNKTSSLKTINLGTIQSRSRYFLKIQDGCEQFCSYCIIPRTRGKLSSRLTRDIVREAGEAVKKGYEEIVLSGIHLGLFGINNKDKKKEEKGANLVSLLKKLVKVKELKKIRLSSIEITEVTDELINFIAEEKKMCKHLHIPLQAGSDKILKLMKRPYTIKYFLDRVRKIRKKMQDVALSTDMIVGFPGEEKKDFFKTLEFIKKINFSRLHVFSFSGHEKTPAFSLPKQVKREEIKRRGKELRSLGKALERQYREKFAGRELEVVVEATFEGRIKGKTEYYFDIRTDRVNIIKRGKKGSLIGKVVKVRA